MSGDLAITYGIGALPLPPLTEEDLGEAHQQMIEEISTSLARIKKDAPHASAQFERSLVTKLVDIHARLFQLMTGKSSGYAMREEVKRARSEIKSFSDRFVEEYSLFKKDHAREESALDTTIAKIKGLSFETKPFQVDSTPDYNSYVQDWVIEKTGSSLDKTYGKLPSSTFKLSAKILKEESSPNSQNPIRDRVISSAISMAMGEIIAKIRGKPSYPLLMTLKGLNDGSHVAESSLSALPHKEEIAYWWDRQRQLTGEGPSFASAHEQSLLLLRLARTPANALSATKSLITEYIAEKADTLGLTEKNIESIARRTLEILAESASQNDINFPG
jgi:hypothetical protein